METAGSCRRRCCLGCSMGCSMGNCMGNCFGSCLGCCVWREGVAQHAPSRHCVESGREGEGLAQYPPCREWVPHYKEGGGGVCMIQDRGWEGGRSCGPMRHPATGCRGGFIIGVFPLGSFPLGGAACARSAASAGSMRWRG